MDMNWLLNTPIAHRGLWDEQYPENSLGAYQKAIENGFNIEIDVHLMADGEFAVFHDPTTGRMCGKNVKVSSLTTEDLKNYSLKGTEYTIPTLTEFLALVNGQVGLLIEMKDVSEKNGAAEKLYAALKDYKGNYAIQSFFKPVLQWWRENTTDIPVGVLSTFWFCPALPALKRKVKPDFYAFDIAFLPFPFITKQQKKGVKLLSWTIKTMERFEKCKKVGVDNVIFDHIRIEKYKD